MKEDARHTVTDIPMPDDYEGKVKATLISFPAERKSDNAVLYIHGYMDYYFQYHMGEYFAAQGYNFHAIDLRKCGRSYMPHQHFNYCRRLEEYFPDIDAALSIIAGQGNENITLIGHSSGGLLASLYCARGRRRGLVNKLILNSPLLEFNMGWLKRNAVVPAKCAISLLQPYAGKKSDIPTGYYKSISSRHNGEWNFDTRYKPEEVPFLYYAWLRAMRKGQKKVRAGLDIQIPILVLFSDKSSDCKLCDEQSMVSDCILDVEDIIKYGLMLGPKVTPAEVPDGMHDLVLSRADVRENVLCGMTEFISSADAFMAVLSILGQ